MSIVGQNIPHDSAVGHVTGRSIYIDDMPKMANELLVDFFYSPIASGKLLSLDLSAASKVPGVVGLYTYHDLASNRLGPIFQDEPLLVEEEVFYIGQPIVVIAAESRKAIVQAKKTIEVSFEEKDPILSIDRARQEKFFLGETRIMERGDVETALRKSDHVIEGVFSCGGQDHFYLESQAALVVPDEYGTLAVHSSTQHPTEVQDMVAHLLGLAANQVVCITRRMGGAFGGKESQATHPAIMAALVASRTGRPARIIYNKDDDMVTTGKRHPFQNHYRAGFTNDGELTALAVDLFSDGGAFADLSSAVMSRAMCHVDNAYYLPATRISGTVCRTHTPPNTAFRGFGGPQGVATIECVLEEIAAYLGQDAYDVRRRNCYGEEPRNRTPYGQVVANNTLPEIFEEIYAKSNYRERRASINKFNQTSRTHLRGMAMTAVKFGISFNTKFLNQASALVHIYLDGSVQVSTGATEMGQGVNTKIRQIVADELGLPVEWVRMMPTSTERSNNASATAASSGTDLNGGAAVNACQKLRARLVEVAASELAVPVDQVVFSEGVVHAKDRPDPSFSFSQIVKSAYLQRVSLGERGFFATPHIHFDPATFTGEPFLYFTNGCAVSEVEIDRFTGELTVLRSDLLMDIGRPINPGIDRGQITGAFVQGMGWVTTEQLVYSPKGELLSHSPTTYKIPNIKDLPASFHVSCIENHSNTVNIRGSKAVGEPPLMLGISVWAAVKNALSYISGSQLPVLSSPATQEEILTRLTHYSKVSESVQVQDESGQKPANPII